MAEYIEREALQNALQRKKSGIADKRYTEGWNDCMIRVKSMVHGAPTANVSPVLHGRWVMKETMIRSPFAKNAYCSECLEETGYASNYCPNCGARMDGDS